MNPAFPTFPQGLPPEDEDDRRENQNRIATSIAALAQHPILENALRNTAPEMTASASSLSLPQMTGCTDPSLRSRAADMALRTLAPLSRADTVALPVPAFPRLRRCLQEGFLLTFA